VRAEAAFACWRIGNRTADALPTLVGILKTERDKFYFDLPPIKEGAPLRSKPPGSNDILAVPGEHARALDHLAEMGVQARDAAAAVELLLQHPSKNVQVAAARTLYAITKDPKRVLPTITGLLKNKGECPHERILIALGIIEDIGPAAIETSALLCQMLKGNDQQVNDAAAAALRRVQSNPRKLP
jgi:hypothetical protein